MDSPAFHQRPGLRSPILVAAFGGWPDAHEAATGAVKHLARKLRARRFAELEPDEFYIFTRLRPTTRVDRSGARVLQWPANEFHYWRDEAAGRDLVLFRGTEPHLRWRGFVRDFLRVVEDRGVRVAILVGSLLDATPHTREPVLTGSAAVGDLQALLASAPAPSSYQGPAGIGTAVVDECQRRGIQCLSLWGHSPHYLRVSANTTVTHALAQRLVSLLGLPLDLGDLAAARASFDARLSRLVGDSSEVRSYVRRLEEQYDESNGRTLGQPPDLLPSPELVIEELEEFLRRRRPGEAEPQGG